MSVRAQPSNTRDDGLIAAPARRSGRLREAEVDVALANRRRSSTDIRRVDRYPVPCHLQALVGAACSSRIPALPDDALDLCSCGHDPVEQLGGSWAGIAATDCVHANIAFGAGRQPAGLESTLHVRVEPALQVPVGDA